MQFNQSLNLFLNVPSITSPFNAPARIALCKMSTDFEYHETNVRATITFDARNATNYIHNIIFKVDVDEMANATIGCIVQFKELSVVPQFEMTVLGPADATLSELVIKLADQITKSAIDKMFNYPLIVANVASQFKYGTECQDLLYNKISAAIIFVAQNMPSHSDIYDMR